VTKSGFGKEKIIPVLVGATGTGKTGVALSLAGRVDGEVISADSRQVYRRLLVGTAKPEGRWVRRASRAVKESYEVEGVPHHLMDMLEPTETYNAGLFTRQASSLVDELFRHRVTPIVVGGTGLYVKSLVDGLAPLPGRDNVIRKALTALAERDGRGSLHKELVRVDPGAGAKIPANNLPRVMRALEVYLLTGRPLTWWQETHTEPSPFRFRWFGLEWPREALDAHLAARCRGMVKAGLLEETEAALKAGVPPDAPGLQAVGYAEAVERVKGKLSQEEFESRFILRTRQYAKRQLTWFRAEKRVRWIPVEGPSDFDGIADRIVRWLED
jgi:tRNA dimethylallyltransferase